MHRVPNANTQTEVGHVATAMNVMLERIQVAFSELQASENRLRRFVSDASHELRTPIAAVSAYAQLFKQGAASERMTFPGSWRALSARPDAWRLVEDLLLLARFDEHRDVHLEPVELVGLVAEAVETGRMVGPGWPITFVAAEAVEVAGDHRALRQVVDNLLANIRGHTPAGTRSEVHVSRIGTEAVIEVADQGPGITEEEAVAVFERFVRADSSRSRITGGAGLGLAIVATSSLAHGGSAAAAPRPGVGPCSR